MRTHGAYRFIGEDGSLGFRHGKVYRLIVETDPIIKYSWPWPKFEDRVYITEFDQNIRCPYSRWKTFWDNWEPAAGQGNEETK